MKENREKKLITHQIADRKRIKKNIDNDLKNIITSRHVHIVKPRNDLEFTIEIDKVILGKLFSFLN